MNHRIKVAHFAGHSGRNQARPHARDVMEMWRRDGFRFGRSLLIRRRHCLRSCNALDGRMPDDQADPCRSCGACCSFAPHWPAFTTDSDADIAAIPLAYVNVEITGMHCNGNRCSALAGKVGAATTCLAYAVRPDVCRACKPGDAECNQARQAFGLPMLAV